MFIAIYKIKNDKLEQYRKICGELVDLVETNGPRLIAFNIYLDEQEGKTAIVIHPDASSMEFHMKVVAEHIAGAFDYLDTESMQVYGQASEGLLERFRQFKEPGVQMVVLPAYEVGFTRTNAG
jgi:hypothetical protein